MSSLYQSAFAQAHHPQCLLDEGFRLLLANGAFCRLLGQPEAALANQPCALLACQPEHWQKSLQEALVRKGYWEGELSARLGQKDLPLWTCLSRLDGGHTLLQAQDISGRKQADIRLHRLAYFDPLTQLPNGSLLSDRLGQGLARARRADSLTVLLLMEPDQGEALREQLGQQAFEQVCRHYANRLQPLLRAEDTLAHLGQGRFGLALYGLANKPAALTAFTQMAEKLRHAANQPFEMLQQGLSLAIGGATFPLDAEDANGLLRRAETALLQARRKGRAQTLLYTPALQQQVMARQQAAGELKAALEQDQLVLHYQPLLDIDSGETLATEALIRWQHPSQGLLLPASFLELAEATGQLRPLGNWVLREAARQFGRWAGAGANLRCVHVNISARQFQSHYLVALVRDVLKDTGLAPSNLCLEITEPALLGEHSDARMAELKALGLQLCLDDFGLGASDLAQLARLPLDQVKLHRSYIQGLEQPGGQKRLRGLAALVKHLELQLLLTGIETPRQLEMAQALGASAVQGFLLRAPVSAGEIGL